MVILLNVTLNDDPRFDPQGIAPPPPLLQSEPEGSDVVMSLMRSLVQGVAATVREVAEGDPRLGADICVALADEVVTSLLLLAAVDPEFMVGEVRKALGEEAFARCAQRAACTVEVFKAGERGDDVAFLRAVADVYDLKD